MTKNEYNGWFNYETWNVKLWIDNEQGTQLFWQERAKELFEESSDNPPFTKLERAQRDLADELKDQHEEFADSMLKQANVESSLFADLLGAALSEVNWHEIAGSMLADIEQEQPA